VSPRGKKRDFASRFVGANIPVGLYEVFNQARAELGYESISESVTAAISVWVEQNPPASGIPKALNELIQASDHSRAIRGVLDQAIVEWRASASREVLVKLVSLRHTVGKTLKFPPDIEEAIQKEGFQE
jgi:metal-responsive CopG/Arc/MetJ family transcriptional regulator